MINTYDKDFDMCFSTVKEWFKIHGFEIESMNDDEFKITKNGASLTIGAKGSYGNDGYLIYDYDIEDTLVDGLPVLPLVSFGRYPVDEPIHNNA